MNETVQSPIEALDEAIEGYSETNAATKGCLLLIITVVIGFLAGFVVGAFLWA